MKKTSLVNKAYSKFSGETVQQVALNLNLNQDTYNALANAIWALIQAFQGCKKTPEQAVTVAKRPASTDVAVVKQVVRKELGLFKNLFQGKKYVKAILDAGQDATVNDLQEVWNG